MVFFFPQVRISAAKALEHKYFDEFLEKSDGSPNLQVEEEGKKEYPPYFETNSKLKINLKVIPIQEFNRYSRIIYIYIYNFKIFSSENSPYLNLGSPDLNSPFFTNKPAINGKTDTIEKIDNNYNSSIMPENCSPNSKPIIELSKEAFMFSSESKSNSNTPGHRTIGQKKSSFNKGVTTIKLISEKQKFDFEQN